MNPFSSFAFLLIAKAIAAVRSLRTRRGLTLVAAMGLASAGPAQLRGESMDDAPRTTHGFGLLGLRPEQPQRPLFLTDVELHPRWGGVRPWIGVLAADRGAGFAGAGAAIRWPVARRLWVGVGSGPFYYRAKGRPHLGFALEFYSYGEVSFALSRRWVCGLRVAHLSNAGLGRTNPGTEFIAFTVGRTRTRR